MSEHPPPPTPHPHMHMLYLEEVYAVPLVGDGNPHSRPRLLCRAMVSRGLSTGDRLHIGEMTGYVVRVEWTYPDHAGDQAAVRTAHVHVATADYNTAQELRPARVPATVGAR